MEDVQLIKLDVDTKRIEEEISALDKEEFFTDASKHPHRISLQDLDGMHTQQQTYLMDSPYGIYYKDARHLLNPYRLA